MSTTCPIFVSTSGTSGDSLEQAQKLFEADFPNIELSGGSHVQNVESRLRELAHSGANLMLHNYFPPPQTPFVFNLASQNAQIVEQSLDLARRAIKLSSEVGARHFAVHSGFLLDPKPEQLGKPISSSPLIDRQFALLDFQKRIQVLADYANRLNVRLLVENNVLSKKNLQNFGTNPFLLVEVEEILNFLDGMDNEIGLLLDIGHLNVSSKSLGFERTRAILELREVAEGYHLSENNGLADDHLALEQDFWGLDYLGSEAEFVTLEIHSQEPTEMFESINLLKGHRGTK